MEPDSRILVTGATGFIGTRLVQALVKRGHRVRALSRRDRPVPLPGFDQSGGDPWRHERVELARGDITDRESLDRAVEGCDYVFHVAAYAKNWAPSPRTYYEINVDAARNVFDAASRSGVRRIVWTSSIVTLGPTRPGEIGDEAMPRITERCLTDYEASKLAAEREAFGYVERGLPLVIVNPTRVYGPGHLTEGNALARLIDDYDRGKVPVLLNRGVNVSNYVLVDDVVEGHVQAMEKGRVGERYILGGQNASLREFFRAIDRASGKRHLQVPILKVSPLVFAWLQQKRAEWFGVYPRITPGWVRTFAVDWAFSCEKAERELGYRPTGLDEGVKRTYQWLMRVREETSMNHTLEPALAAFRDRQRKPTVILLCSAFLLIAWKYGGSPEFYLKWLRPYGVLFDDPAATAGMYSLVSCFVLLGIVPVLIVKSLFHERLADYGVQLGDQGRTLRSILLLGPLFVLGGYLASRDPAVAAAYPINPSAGRMFGLHAVSYVLFYLGWEFYFRGFIQLGLRESLGDTNALLVQVLASTLLHIGKPGSEAFGAVFGGLLWGVLVYRTRSLLSGLVQHALLGLSLDWFLCYG